MGKRIPEMWTTLQPMVAFLMLLCLFSLNSHAQKTFYSERAESWESSISEKNSEKLYSIYLIGDLKYPNPDNENLELFKRLLSQDSSPGTALVLGDILYPLGLPDSNDITYHDAEQKLKYILKLFDTYQGEVKFIPGNHDWSRGREQGISNLNNLEKYIERHFDQKNVFLPDGGCPGPVELELSDDITLIIFDSQWYFHKHEKPESGEECEFESLADVFRNIEDAFRRNKDKKVIFAAHHPLFSAGNHGGYFPLKFQLFPLLEFNNWMYLPLPGFIYTGYRKYLGHMQDMAHPDYKIFKKSMLDILKDYPNVIYAAGHEHNLQYLETNGMHHIISGGGGEGTYITRNSKKSDFAYQGIGFTKLSFYSNGNVWMEFIRPDESENGEVIYRKKLFNKPVFDPGQMQSFLQTIDYSDSVVTVKLSDIYSKGNFHKLLFGENYRNVWETDVELPVFDIGKEKGGLTILKRGGGQQTRSIRLEDKDGRQYVLRSVNKYLEKAMDENLQNTVAIDVVQDGISASHPFASITVPNLADAAGVMHTNPRIIWLPDDPRLGIYRKDLANDVFLFEERPAGNRADVSSFGRSEKIVNTAKTIKKTQAKHEHKVDQFSVLRARLFDIYINDWDRHDDQWRWATFSESGETIYRPIPRDRDQVYFINQGLVMWLISKNWSTRKFQGFDYSVDDVVGLGYNARYFDRAFLSEPELDDWLSIANDLQKNITDSVIHKAISNLPDRIYDSTGLEIENKLIARKELITEFSKQYYLELAKAVDIVGTNKRDLFEIHREENGNTQVNVFAISKKKGNIKEEIYSRYFKYDETKEIRLYGLDGKDIFKVNGNGDKGIKIRIIGGKNNDSIVDESKVRGFSKKTIVYDRKDKKNVVLASKETKVHLSKKKSINKYNRKQFKHNVTTPYIYGGYNIDDGIFTGMKANINRFNFRDSTFHRVYGIYAFQTGAFELGYEGLYTSISQTFDLTLDAVLSIPRGVDNFFGLGNETTFDHDKKYYRVRYEYVSLNPKLKHTINDKLNYSFGTFYQYYKVTDTTDRFMGEQFPENLSSSAYAAHNYTGLSTCLEIDTRDDHVLPKRGMYWRSEVTGYYSIMEDGRNFAKINSDLRFYLSFTKDPRLVLAFRFGGASNLGEYEFYHANYLGGKSGLRGYRSNRFAGDHFAYQNTEVRLKLMNIRSYILNGQLGLLIFNDVGRVWVNGEKSNKWHHGYGTGIWLTPFDFTALTLTYNMSEEDGIVDFSFRFLF